MQLCNEPFQLLSGQCHVSGLFLCQGDRAEQAKGVYKKASMQDTSFGDVDNLRIGATGYVYCHQGCCEHALYIKDVRRIHPDDPQRASAYPVQTFQVSSSLVQACL